MSDSTSKTELYKRPDKSASTWLAINIFRDSSGASLPTLPRPLCCWLVCCCRRDWHPDSCEGGSEPHVWGAGSGVPAVKPTRWVRGHTLLACTCKRTRLGAEHCHAAVYLKHLYCYVLPCVCVCSALLQHILPCGSAAVCPGHDRAGGWQRLSLRLLVHTAAHNAPMLPCVSCAAMLGVTLRYYTLCLSRRCCCRWRPLIPCN